MSEGGQVLIREAREDERDAVRELTMRAYSQYATEMAAGAWLALEGAVRQGLEASGRLDRLVAELDGKLVGSVLLFFSATEAYEGPGEHAPWPELRLLAVAPEGRRRGIAQALVRECVRRARNAGAPELGLHTSASMTAAIRMYEAMGFTRAPEHDFRPDGAELVMGYRLRLKGEE